MKKAFFSTELLREVRTRNDLVQIVGEYVKLIPSGKSFKALCPFHQEKTPSFFVSPEKQLYHCYGCKKSGDVFQFLIDIEGFTFPQAVEMLAQRAGISLEAEQDPELERKAAIYRILESAAKIYSEQLANFSNGKLARDYLESRGIKSETAKKFQLGFAPNQWDFLTLRLGRNSESLQLLQLAGLIKKRNTGDGYYDTFRNRLMIPIYDLNGRVVGFGGRVIFDNDQPKYLNSPETEVFNKGRIVFNLKNALQAIRKANSVVLVEGYLDVISLVQHGIENVVATLGTAVTPFQIQLLARNCETIYFGYDADEAGQKAILRAVSMNLETPLNPKVIIFPNPDDDPDSFIQREGAKAFQQILEKSQDIYTFIVSRYTRGAVSLSIPEKEKIIAQLKPFVNEIQSPIARNEVITKISKMLSIEAKILEKSFLSQGVIRIENRVSGKSGSTAEKLVASKSLEEWLIKHLVESPQELGKVLSQIVAADFSDPSLRKIFQTLCSLYETAEGKMSPADILAALDDSDSGPRFSELMISLENAPPISLDDCLKNLVRRKLEKEAREIQKKIQLAESQGNEAEVRRLMCYQMELKKRKLLLS